MSITGTISLSNGKEVQFEVEGDSYSQWGADKESLAEVSSLTSYIAHCVSLFESGELD